MTSPVGPAGSRGMQGSRPPRGEYEGDEATGTRATGLPLRRWASQVASTVNRALINSHLETLFGGPAFPPIDNEE